MEGKKDLRRVSFELGQEVLNLVQMLTHRHILPQLGRTLLALRLRWSKDRVPHLCTTTPPQTFLRLEKTPLPRLEPHVPR
mmetsp:Transcript_21587/g.67707  ORF Transcript_21587/g.67707 Transcript_21587/m.67707 type:complete len:80 (-) Transcript_21587:118-357(-)